MTSMKIFFTASLFLFTCAAPLEPRAGNVKTGVPYNDANAVTPFQGSSVTWAYNYGTSSGGLSSSFQYVPMIHDAGTDVSPIASGGYQYVLGYNEPDRSLNSGGTAISPADAWASWSSQISGLENIHIGSPAVSSVISSGKGLDWLKQFVAAAGGASNTRIDFVCLHWYGGGGSGADQAADLMSYLDMAAQTIDTFLPGKPIWLTEFAAVPLDNQDVQTDFLSAILPSLDSNSRVGRYAAFAAINGELVSGGSLTQSGRVYAAG